MLLLFTSNMGSGDPPGGSLRQISRFIGDRFVSDAEGAAISRVASWVPKGVSLDIASLTWASLCARDPMIGVGQSGVGRDCGTTQCAHTRVSVTSLPISIRSPSLPV